MLSSARRPGLAFQDSSKKEGVRFPLWFAGILESSSRKHLLPTQTDTSVQTGQACTKEHECGAFSWSPKGPGPFSKFAKNPGFAFPFAPLPFSCSKSNNDSCTHYKLLETVKSL